MNTTSTNSRRRKSIQWASDMIMTPSCIMRGILFQRELILTRFFHAQIYLKIKLQCRKLVNGFGLAKVIFYKQQLSINVLDVEELIRIQQQNLAPRNTVHCIRLPQEWSQLLSKRETSVNGEFLQLMGRKLF